MQAAAGKSFWLYVGAKNDQPILEAAGMSFRRTHTFSYLGYVIIDLGKPDGGNKRILSQSKKVINSHAFIPEISKFVNTTKSELGGNIYGSDCNLGTTGYRPAGQR